MAYNRGIDLNLLPILDAIFEELHISRAAKRLNLSQPAVSRALARLRTEFDDELIVKDRNGYRRTPRGEELSGRVKKILMEVDAAKQASNFDPKSFDGEFKICTLDYGEATLIPLLQEDLTKVAPLARIRIVHRRIYSISEVLEGAADLLLGTIPENPPRHCVVEHLFADRHVCVMCKNHRLAQTKLTLKHYVELPHSIIHTGESPGTAIDATLRQMGRHRTVARSSPHFVASLMSIANTELVQTVPETLAKSLAEKFDLVIKELPLEVAQVDIGQMWHSRNDNDGAHMWFRQRVKNVAGKIAGFAS